jgi:hypothetical protein
MLRRYPELFSFMVTHKLFSETELPQHTLSMAIGKSDTSHAATENSRAGIWYIEGFEEVLGTRS